MRSWSLFELWTVRLTSELSGLVNICFFRMILTVFVTFFEYCFLLVSHGLFTLIYTVIHAVDIF
jgi:hypothetical protein